MGFDRIDLREHVLPPRPRRWAPHTNTVHGISVRASTSDTERLHSILDVVDAHVLRAVGAAGLRIVLMEPWETYATQSRHLEAYGAVADRLPISPAGIFSRLDRTIFLRERSAAAAIHELGHAVDFTLGVDDYASTTASDVAAAFAEHRFVTAYAAQNRAEYFAEGFRAWHDADAPYTAWQHVSHEHLRTIDPALYRIMGNAIDVLNRNARPA